MSDIVLSTHDLTKRFGSRAAVDGVSLEVHRGDIFGYLGPNGAGKSTSIRMILGLMRPSGGSIRLLGEPVGAGHRGVMARVGAIVESPTFYGTLSARQNLELFSALSGTAPAGRIDEILDLVGLRDRQHDKVCVFSTGMKQRLGIAQALLPDPEIVILDEPSLGLDPRGMVEMRDLILHLRDERGLTVFLSSHLLAEVQQICSRVAIIDRGKLRYQGSVGGLLKPEHRVRIRVDRPAEAQTLLSGLPNVRKIEAVDGAIQIELADDDPAEAIAALVRAGFRIREVVPLTASLEDVFLSLTGPSADGSTSLAATPAAGGAR